MLSSLLYKWRNWLERGLMLLRITQLESNINGSDAWAFWIHPLPAIALYNNSFKDIELPVSRKGACKAFTGTKSGEKKKNLKFWPGKNRRFSLLPKNLLAESKMPVGHGCWYDSRHNLPMPCLASQIQGFMRLQGQCMASLHGSTCICH